MRIVNMQTRTFWKGEFGIDGPCRRTREATYRRRNLEVKGSHINSYSWLPRAKGNSYKEMCPHEKALYQHYLKQVQDKGRTAGVHLYAGSDDDPGVYEP